MSHQLVRLPSISDLTILLNQREIAYPVHHPPSNQMWYNAHAHTQPQPQQFYSPNSQIRLYPLQLVLLIEAHQDAPRSMVDNFRFVLGPVAPRRRKKHKPADLKNRPTTHHRHATGESSRIGDPSVNYPIHEANLLDFKIPEEQLRYLKLTVYPSIETKRYSASALDPSKTHLMVYEYAVGAQWVIWDHDTGYVHLTGLWRAALQEKAIQKNGAGVMNVKANAKADIVKLLELTPKALHSYIKRVRGGYLKIQGTWVPFFLCKKLAVRFCYYIRYKLVPIFGPEFPSQCLKPTDLGFGELRFDDSASTLVLPQNSPHIQLDVRTPTQNSHGDYRQMNSFHAVADLAILPKTEVPMHLEPNQTFSAVKDEISTPSRDANTSVKSADSLAEPMLNETVQPAMTYSDMVDLVNASKCLQLLSQRSLMSLESGEVHQDKMRINNLLS